MTRLRFSALPFLMLAGAALLSAQLSQQVRPATKGGATTPAKKAPAPAPAAGAPMTNRDVIRLVQAKISEGIIAAKIRQSKTNFDTSVDGIVALKQAGVSDSLISVMMNPAAAPEPGGGTAPAGTGGGTAAGAGGAVHPASEITNRPSEAAPTNAKPAARTPYAPPVVTTSPTNYGVYIWSEGGLKPLGRMQTKVQVSKFRSLLKSIPLVRQKIDINLPGAHSTSRFDETRPTFFAFFPPSRDVSKFKLLQCKITGQRFDQRTLANASMLFSTEQNQDEVPVDIGPTSVKDLYRISPREDVPSGEYGFVEGNTGSKSTSNIEILDVYDFALDRKEDKLGLKDYLSTLPPASIGGRAFLDWSRETCQTIVSDRTGKTGLTGSLMGWFDRQYASLDVYWADGQFARAFARLEMLDKNLTPDEAVKLASMLLSPDGSQYYIMVSIGGKIGSGKLIGANEGERMMRPFDASLADEKSKVIVPARRLEFVGGYAGLWKVSFDQQSIRGPLLQGGTLELNFEARLNQNLEFKAKFDTDKINADLKEAGGGKP